ncbi:MAG: glycosyltransferase family 2 protein, partial [Elusimicrobiota bacterium]|nr:glycosyltransferase family 2 protein [Elusimicrobiota bacterium]
MKLSIIIPVYNEEKTILAVVDKVLKTDFGISKEIIIVDDGSTDETPSILKKLQISDCKIIFHTTNKGKGAAVKTGIENSTGDIIAIQDADLEYNPEELKYLIKPILEGKSLVVYGSRFMKDNPVLYKKYYLGNKFMSWFISLLFGQKITDSYTCYKVFHKKVLENIKLESKRFELEAELTCKFLKYGYKILELPISY